MVLGKLNRYRKMKLYHLLIPHTRINSKWTKDLNVTPQTIKILEENIGSKILDITHSKFLLGISPQGRETKEKINKWDCIKLKTFLHSKGNHPQNDNPYNGRAHLLIHLIGG